MDINGSSGDKKLQVSTLEMSELGHIHHTLRWRSISRRQLGSRCSCMLQAGLLLFILVGEKAGSHMVTQPKGNPALMLKQDELLSGTTSPSLLVMTRFFIYFLKCLKASQLQIQLLNLTWCSAVISTCHPREVGFSFMSIENPRQYLGSYLN